MKNTRVKFLSVILLILSILTSSVNAQIYSYGNNNEQRRGRGLGGVMAINEATELRLNQIIDSVNLSNRENFIRQTLTKVDNLELSIQNYETRAELKGRKLAFLGEIRDILELRLKYLPNSSTNNYQNLNYSIVLNQTSSSSLNTTITTNQSGKGYYVVLPSGSYSPSGVQIKSGIDGNGNSVPSRGNMNLSSGDNQLNIVGFNSGTSYVLYFVAEDINGNLSSNVINLAFQTTTDSIINNSTQNIKLSLNSINGTTINGTIVTNTAGKGYYMILPDNSTTPSQNQIRLGLDNNGYVSPFKGSLNLINGTNQFSVIGLSSNTSYKMYLVEEDNSGNIIFNILTLTFNTSGTSSNPTNSFSINISSLYTTASTLNATVTTNQPGRGYYVILPTSSSVPTAYQVKSGFDNSGNYAYFRGNIGLSNGGNQLNVSGLGQNTSYILYFAYEDSSGNLVSGVTNLPFQTNNSGGSATQNISISINTVNGTSLNGTITSNSTAKGYYVVLPSNESAPTAYQTKFGYDSHGNNVSYKGNMNITIGSNQLNVLGLAQNTSYILYFAYEDGSGNLNSTVIKLPFQITATTTTTTPSYLNQYVNIVITPNVSGISGTVNVNVAGRGYYEILPSYAPRPTSLQIKEGLDGNSNTTNIKGNLYLYTGDNQLSITGLNSGTSYILYFTAVDVNRNLQPNPIAIPFTTR